MALTLTIVILAFVPSTFLLYILFVLVTQCCLVFGYTTKQPNMATETTWTKIKTKVPKSVRLGTAAVAIDENTTLVGDITATGMVDQVEYIPHYSRVFTGTYYTIRHSTAGIVYLVLAFILFVIYEILFVVNFLYIPITQDQITDPWDYVLWIVSGPLALALGIALCCCSCVMLVTFCKE